MRLKRARNLDWTERTYSLAYLRSEARLTNLTDAPQPRYVAPWLKEIDIVPWTMGSRKVLATYPTLDANAISGRHLASLALEWDALGPCRLTQWLDMVELECNGGRDDIVHALEAAGVG